MQHIGRGLAFALPLRIIYLSQTLFELVLDEQAKRKMPSCQRCTLAKSD